MKKVLEIAGLVCLFFLFLFLSTEFSEHELTDEYFDDFVSAVRNGY